MTDNTDNNDDKTRIMEKTPTAPVDDATVLSATAVEAFATESQVNDATIAMPKPAPGANLNDTVPLAALDQATILAGGTQAVQQAISTTFAPRVGIGSVINDRFTLEKLLGRGGMGEVYLATDKRKIEAQDKNPYVALKVLGENFKRHPQAFIALQREARKTQELAHPNIVTVYDFDRQGDTVYLTMEALNGKPMDEEIRNEQRSVAEAVSLITQCASGLAYAHQKSLVHSDLKPGNVFITADGNVKLLDFGIARACKVGKELDSSDDDKTVFDAGELGALTPAYASLEMIQGETPHPSDDVYALGLIAYELLTGKHPFDKQMASKAKEQGLKPERIKGLSKQQWQAIEKALAFERQERCQNAQEFLTQFTAKSKTPLYIAAAVITAAFIGIGSINFFIEPEIGPEVPFEQLPAATQQAVTQQLDDAGTALKFGDYNGAILHLNNAFELHPYNPQVMAAVDKTLDPLLKALQQYDLATQAKQIKVLMQYPALSNNKRLQALLER